MAALAEYVKKELWGYLDCGLLCKGALRVSCPDCQHSVVVGLSCKGRGVCPSCGGRRMNDTAAHLVDRVLPENVPVRQWVLSLPHRYRLLLARDVLLLQAVVRSFVRVVFGQLCRTATEQGIVDPRPGAFVAVQRFGDGLVHNVHLHAVFLQGVYHRPAGSHTLSLASGPSSGGTNRRSRRAGVGPWEAVPSGTMTMLDRGSSFSYAPNSTILNDFVSSGRI